MLFGSSRGVVRGAKRDDHSPKKFQDQQLFFFDVGCKKKSAVQGSGGGGSGGGGRGGGGVAVPQSRHSHYANNAKPYLSEVPVPKIRPSG